MDLVDEENDIPLRLHDFLHDLFESLFKLALILRTGNQCAHIEAVELFVLQVFGHVAAQNTMGQTLHDGSLAGARLTDEHGIVLGASGQNLQDTANLLVTTDHGVEFALAGLVHKIAGIELQGFLLLLLVVHWIHHSCWWFKLVCVFTHPVQQRACNDASGGHYVPFCVILSQKKINLP